MRNALLAVAILSLAGCGEPSPRCAALLSCLDATDPAAFEQQQQEVGARSDCWSQGAVFAASACDAQCWTQLSEVPTTTDTPECDYEEAADYTHLAAKSFAVGSTELTFADTSFQQEGCSAGDGDAVLGCASTGSWSVDAGVLTLSDSEGNAESGPITRTPRDESTLQWTRDAGALQLVRQ